MLGWFQALMPKEARFFALFEEHAGIVVAGAEALRGLLEGGNTVASYCQQIFQREAEADDVTREVLVAVGASTARSRSSIRRHATMRSCLFSLGRAASGFLSMSRLSLYRASPPLSRT